MSEWTISAEALRHVCPNLDGRTAVTIAKGLGEAFARCDIVTPARAAMALAQWAHECDHFRTSEEYGSGAGYEGRKDLGNTRPGDGKRFKGRGRIQITGRANYVAMAKTLGIDCVNKPELLAQSPYSELVSGQWWKDHGCNALCDKADFVGLTRRINGATNGLVNRRRLYALALQVAIDLVPLNRMAVLTATEREQIEILTTERRIAVRNGGWGKVDPSHHARATKAKRWLVARMAEIRNLAAAEPSGWSNANRKARFELIEQAISGSSAPGRDWEDRPSSRIRLGDRGANVKAHQSSLNARLRAHRDPPIDEDGDCGRQTIEQSAYAAWFLGALDGTIDKVKGGLIPVGVQAIIQDPSKRDRGQLKRGRERREQHFGDLGARALKVADGLVGIMEEGQNNAGPMVLKIIRANGGSGPEAWCGDFVAYCYRQAGSVGVERLWCSVSQVSKDPDVHSVTAPQPGDLVRFTFDHIGLFVRNVGSSQIETIEGNTGRNGAVSDSKTGGDGVYRKRRAKALVADYLRVER